jgi:ribosomal protein S18 acetylase RimI-like enzyme
LASSVRNQLADRLSEQPGVLVLLASVDDQPAGLAVCYPSFSTFLARPILNIHDLAVAPKYRGQGIGWQLLLSVEEHARCRDCCSITLEVRGDNEAAQRLYRRFGFVGGTGITPGECCTFWKKMLDAERSATG